jgi:hypothetical protein
MERKEIMNKLVKKSGCRTTAEFHRYINGKYGTQYTKQHFYDFEKDDKKKTLRDFLLEESLN